jgi:hypothetical protein
MPSSGTALPLLLTKAYTARKGEALPSLNFITRWSWVVSLMFRPSLLLDKELLDSEGMRLEVLWISLHVIRKRKIYRPCQKLNSSRPLLHSLNYMTASINVYSHLLLTSVSLISFNNFNNKRVEINLQESRLISYYSRYLRRVHSNYLVLNDCLDYFLHQEQTNFHYFPGYWHWYHKLLLVVMYYVPEHVYILSR